MEIRTISEQDWPAILNVQSDVYIEVPPEELEVLQCKQKRSPESCFVCDVKGEIKAYLIAHSWNQDSAPKLHKLLASGTEGDRLYLHDMAVSAQAGGMGLGRRLVESLLRQAKEKGYRDVRLVAVQGSTGFWEKMGFSALPNMPVCSSYGDHALMMVRSLC